MFGSNHLYVFQHPALHKAKPSAYTPVTYEMAQQEIAQKNGFDMSEKKSGGEVKVQILSWILKVCGQVQYIHFCQVEIFAIETAEMYNTSDHDFRNIQ